MATNYQRGVALERWALGRLRDAGWTATRTAGSHGVADVWAAREGACFDLVPPGGPVVRLADLALVQCKLARRGAPPSEWISLRDWNDLHDAALAAGAEAVLCVRPAPRASVQWWRILGRRAPRQRSAAWPWERWTEAP